MEKSPENKSATGTPDFGFRETKTTASGGGDVLVQETKQVTTGDDTSDAQADAGVQVERQPDATGGAAQEQDSTGGDAAAAPQAADQGTY